MVGVGGDLRYLSLFSGIEAATVAWESLGWEPVGFAEFEDFPKAVLAHHYPTVPDLGDVTQITEEQVKALGHIDIVVGGSPCQDLSIAGKRAGLKADDGSATRSGLFDEQIRIFEIARKYCGARYCLWENVPGAFSSNSGHDFSYVLGSMVGGSIPVPVGGWKNSGVAINGSGSRLVEWRVLDAQYFGVAQRRRRIFALLDTGAWWSRWPILLEQGCVRRNFAQSGVKRERVAEGIKDCVGECGVYAVRTAQTGANGIGIAEEKSHTLDGANGQAVIYDNHGTDGRMTRCEDVSPTLISRMGTGGNNVPLVMSSGQANAEIGWDMSDAELQSRATNPRIATGIEVFPTLLANVGDKQWLGNQEALTGNYHILEDNTMVCKMEEKVQVLMDQGGAIMNVEFDKVGTLRRETHGHEPIIHHNTVVRRLTPI